MTSVVIYLTNTPLGLYGDIVIEMKYGFNKMTLEMLVMDPSIELGLQSSSLLLLMWGGNFYWYFWVVCQAMISGFMLIYPTLAMPLLNKFEPLHDKALHQGIGDLVAGLS